MRKLLFLLSVLFVTTSAFSQHYGKNRKEAAKYKNNTDYYWGESDNCKSQSKADEVAINALLENISSDNSMQGLFFIDSDEDEAAQRTRSMVTFNDEIKMASDELILNDEPQKAGVFRYISKADFAKICSRREEKINRYISDGLSAEEQMRYGIALRYYYWAMMLCHSHPNGAGLKFKYDGVNSVPTYHWLHKHTEDLLHGIVIQPKRQEKTDDDQFILFITNGSDRVDGLDFQYTNGNGYAKGTTENGLSYIKMVHPDMDNVKIQIELENKNIAKSFDADVYRVMDKLDEQIVFADAVRYVNIGKAKKMKSLDEFKTGYNTANASVERSEQFLDALSSPHAEIAKVMAEIEKTLTKKGGAKAADIEPYFTSEGMDMMRRLLAYGKVSIVGKTSYKFIDFGDEVICRSIPMQFDFARNTSFMRNIAFRFDKKTNKVKSIAFRLTDITESQILGKEMWSENARLTLINFIEDYQTAYALQRREYLEQIYSESALIVVGSVLKNTKKTDNVLLKEEVKVKYDTLSKSQYMTRLNNVFDNNEFVNLNFTNTSFNTVNGKQNVIGVQLRQEYFSSSYTDVGYLFLMVDLRGKLPVIEVRTWQPNETPVDELIDNSSFVFR